MKQICRVLNIFSKLINETANIVIGVSFKYQTFQDKDERKGREGKREEKVKKKRKKQQHKEEKKEGEKEER